MFSLALGADPDDGVAARQAGHGCSHRPRQGEPHGPRQPEVRPLRPELGRELLLGRTVRPVCSVLRGDDNDRPQDW